MSTPDDRGPLVFVSHATEDAEAAGRVAACLEARGVRCWIAPRDIDPGAQYGEAIIAAIERADALLLVMSAAANGSRHVASEVSRAFSRGKLIVPLRIDRSEPGRALELFAASAHWVEARDGEFGLAADRVAATVRGQPAPAPAARSRPRRPHTSLVAVAAGLALLAAAMLWRWGPGPAAPHWRGSTPPKAAARPPVARPESAALRYQALVIGINAYAAHAGQGWQPLASARGDAEAVGRALADRYGFSVRLLVDGQATRGAILTALDAVAAAGPDDAVLIYYAGHGFYDEHLREGYWIPADARQTADGHPAKEDWLWNSTITRILGATSARHVLVLADACYSGSLFRGDTPLATRNNLAWYGRALAKPSRYLIASGGIEPVLDSEGRHSVFAQQILNYLEHGGRDVFAASDLGLSLRERVAALTGQMVLMGPLPVATHAGGEFVFVRSGSAPPPLGAAVAGAAGTRAPAAPQERQAALQDALALDRDGAPQAARKLAAAAVAGAADDRLARAVADFLDRDRRQASRDSLRQLIARIEERRNRPAAGEARDTDARPRILACIGPSIRNGAPAAENLCMLYRIGLQAELARSGRLRVVEREDIESVLREVEIGASDLADPRARTAIGRLLPACVLALGDLVVDETGEQVFLRLVDTETSQVLAVINAARRGPQTVEQVAADLAGRLASRVVTLKPLAAAVTDLNGTRIQAGVGRFQGGVTGAVFAVVDRQAADPRSPGDVREQPLGSARVVSTSEFAAELEVAWDDPQAVHRTDTLWVRERVE
jgi:hypothetical protein